MKVFKSKWFLTFLAVLGMALCFSGGYATAKLTQTKPTMPKNIKKGTPPEGTPPNGNSSDSSQSNSNSDSNDSDTNSNSSTTTNG